MKVRKKVATYDAVTFYPDLYPLPDGVTMIKGKSGRGKYNLRTADGLVRIKPGMWIVTHPVLKTRIAMTVKEFQELYEAVQ